MGLQRCVADHGKVVALDHVLALAAAAAADDDGDDDDGDDDVTEACCWPWQCRCCGPY